MGKREAEGMREEKRAEVEFFKNTRELSYKRVCNRCLFIQGALIVSGKNKMSNKPDYSESRQHIEFFMKQIEFFMKE